MRKNMIFGVIGFALALVAGGHAFAAGTTPTNISMGMFSIPLPSNGVDGKDGKDGAAGCTPTITVGEKDNNTGCYTVTIQKQKLGTNGCENDGTEITRTTCDGAKSLEDVTSVYTPYPQSADANNPDREGFLTITYTPTGNSDDAVVDVKPDECELFYEPNGTIKKKCTAKGPGETWKNTDGDIPYQEGDTYIFTVSGMALDSYYEYVHPSKGTNGWYQDPGYTRKVNKYPNGQKTYEFVRVDVCEKWKKPGDSTDRVEKCTVGAPGDSESGYTAGQTTYCLNVNPNTCDSYSVNLGTGPEACVGAGDNAPHTVRTTTTQYNGPTGNQSSNSRTPGYVTTTQVMCSNNTNDNITSLQYDGCVPAAQGGTPITCASGYAWQTCTNQTDTNDTYSGCFPDSTGGQLAYKTDIVPANFASDGTNLYYCQIQDCDNTAACWIDGNKVNGPNPNGKSNGTNCWGVVSIDGLQGDAGPGCSFAYYDNKWQVCCLPVDSSGNVNVSGTWDCNEVTNATILNYLNNWICKPTYTTYYIDKTCSGGTCTYSYNRATASNDRAENTVGIRTVITNCDNTPGGSIDVFDDDTCRGLAANSVAAQTTIQSQTSVYRPRTYTSNHYTPARGYYEKTVTYCEGSTTTYESDVCEPVADTRTEDRCDGEHQVYKECTPWEGSTEHYYICDTISGTSPWHAATTEVNGSPNKVYHAPKQSGNVYTAPGYVQEIHTYLDGRSAPGSRQEDYCQPATKRQTRTSNSDIIDTVAVRKCKVQSYTNPESLLTTWYVGRKYCLNLPAGDNCDSYYTPDERFETVRELYQKPEMKGTSGNDATTPISKGYAYKDIVDNDGFHILTEITPDSCIDVVKSLDTASSGPNDTRTTQKCFVHAPGDTSTGAVYTTGHEYCLGEVDGGCTGYVPVGTAVDPCSSLSANATEEQKMALIKKTTRVYTEPTGSGNVKTAVGYTRFTRETCSTNTPSVTDKEEDICNPVMPANPSDCPDGVYYACSNQNYDNGNTYYYCDTTYPQCAGTNSNSNSILKKTVRSYTGPVKTSNNDAYYTTVGKMTDKKIACSNAEISTNESMEDECHEIADSGSSPVCPANASVRKTCKRQGAAGTFWAESEYILCTTGLSIAASDPCEGDTTSNAAKKKVKKIEYEYVEPSAPSDVGFTKKTTVMCHSSEPNKEEYIYDTCISVPAVSACGNGSYYKCYNQTKLTSNTASEREYNVCNPNSNVSTVALADSVKAQSLFEIWKEQYKDLTSTKCTALFGDSKTNCQTDLDETDMLNNINAYGVWKTDQVVNQSNTTATELTFAKYQESLQPCKNGFSIVENAEYSGGNGKEYVMVCNE